MTCTQDAHFLVAADLLVFLELSTLLLSAAALCSVEAFLSLLPNALFKASKSG